MVKGEARLEDLPYHLRWMLRRRAANIAQKDLAGALGVAPTALSAYENDRRLPSDPVEFDRRHREAVGSLAAERLVLRDVPVAVGDQFVSLIDELSQRINVSLRVTRHRVAEDRTNYVVEIPKRDAPSDATTRKRGKQRRGHERPGNSDTQNRR